jgi:hypothetical protein
MTHDDPSPPRAPHASSPVRGAWRAAAPWTAVRASAPRVAVLAVALLAGCGDGTGAREIPGKPAGKVLVIGVDGLEWKVLRPLLAAGKCPNLRALMERGSFGQLATIDPTLSPIIWTTIATGRMPKAHGVHDFLDPDGKEYTSSRRAVPAVWNIADRYGIASDVIGWWITWPVEPIQGVMVSGTSSGALAEVNWKPSLLPGAPHQVWPEALDGEVMALAEEAGSQDKVKALARERIFGALPEGRLDQQQKDLEQTTLWSLQSDLTFDAIARRVFSEHPAQLNMVYFGGTDVVSHRYWRQYEPGAYAWQGSQPELDAAQATVIPNYYEWIDGVIGGLVAAVGEGANVIVLSDHGFHAIHTDKPPGPEARGMTGHHVGAPAGVLVAAGPDITHLPQCDVGGFLQAGALPSIGSVADITPTVLALLGIPTARDMKGRPLASLLAGPARENAALPLVETHDTGFRPPTMDELPPEMQDSFQERFGELGYLDNRVDMAREPVIVAPQPTTPGVPAPPSLPPAGADKPGP